MDTLLSRKRFIQIFTGGTSSVFAGVLNFLLFLAILVSLFTSYVFIGLGLVFIIISIEIWLGLKTFALIRSTSIRYRILDAVAEWYVDEKSSGRINSKKILRILLTQTVNSICYYLEPGESIKEVKGALAVYSNKICTDIPYGYTSVDLFFERYLPQGTEVQIEITTEMKKEEQSQPNLISFYTHNEPQRLSMVINVRADNGNHPKATIQYLRGKHKKVITEPNVKVIREGSCKKIVWESDELIENAIYNINLSDQ